MPNPLDYLTKEQIRQIGLSEQELSQVYQPSSGHVYHARGAENAGKTLWIAKRVKYLIDTKRYSSYDITGNVTFKGKYGIGATVLKGDDLFQFLWDFVHKQMKHKIVVISEIDTEFPARFFPDKDQTEIAIGMWHISKFGSMVFMDSHLGRSTDLIFSLSSHYNIYPESPNWLTNSLNFHVIDRLLMKESNWTVYNIIQAMLVYNRQESTLGRFKDRKPKRLNENHQGRPSNKVIVPDDWNEIPSDGLPIY